MVDPESRHLPLPHWPERSTLIAIALWLVASILTADVVATFRSAGRLADVAAVLRQEMEAAAIVRGKLLIEHHAQREALDRMVATNETQHLVLSQLVREHRRYWRLICLNTARSEEAVRGCFTAIPRADGTPGDPGK